MSPTSLLTSPGGSSRPRVEVHPPYVFSLGPEAIELARRGGLILDPWQCDALTCMLGVRSDGKWACFEYGEIVARQNGKGGILEGRALAGLFLLGEQLIMWSAHEYKTAMEAFRRVMLLLRRLGTRINENLFDVDGILVKVINTNGEESLERLDTGARIKFIARSKGSGRGFSGDVNIIDEAFAYTRVQQEALMPTMSARPNPQIIYTSSPPLTGDTGEVMYALRARADAGGDDSLGWRDWGLPGDLDHVKVDLDDPNLWAQTNPAFGGRLTAEFVARERRSMSITGFARERLGIWPREIDTSKGWAVISEADWAAALDEHSQAGTTIALAVSVSWDRKRSAIGVAGPRVDGLMHGEVVESGSGTGWVVRRLKELRDAWQPAAVVVNPGAPAGSLIPEIEDEGIEVTQVSSRETAQAFGAFYDLVCGAPYQNDAGELIDPRRFRHIGQEELTAGAIAGVSRKLGDGHAWDLKEADGDVTGIDAVTLAVHGYLTREVEEGPEVLIGSLMAQGGTRDDA